MLLTTGLSVGLSGVVKHLSEDYEKNPMTIEKRRN